MLNKKKEIKKPGTLKLNISSDFAIDLQPFKKRSAIKSRFTDSLSI